MVKPISRIWLYRAAALLAFLIAQLVVLLAPQQMQEPGDWAILYATENFAHGHFTLSEELYIQQSQQLWDQGGQLLGYAEVPGNRWAPTMAPGYVFYLAPFQAAGAPQLGGTILSLGLAAVVYLLISRLKDEKTAFLGVLLLLFTPAYLAMWQRTYMDSLAALATCGIGGALYLYYWISQAKLCKRGAVVLLLLAGLFLGIGVAVRYTNIFIAAVFGIHFLVMTVRAHIKRQGILREALALVLGASVPVAALMIYHNAVFGSAFKYGYEFSQIPVNFAWQYLGQGMAWDIIRKNVINLWAPLLIAFPLLIVAIPAFIVIGWHKARRSGDFPELPRHLYPSLSGWAWFSIFGLYIMYEWTAYQEAAKLVYILLTRFYLPWLLPLVVMSALLLAHLPSKVRWSAMVVAVSLGLLFYFQAARMQVQFGGGITPPSLSLPIANETAAGLSEMSLEALA